jgi:hypothetical protein
LKTPPPSWPGLLDTCRQIHHETHLLPFSLNTVDCSRHRDFKLFLNILYQYPRKGVTSLRLNLAVGLGCDGNLIKAFSHLEMVYLNFDDSDEQNWIKEPKFRQIGREYVRHCLVDGSGGKIKAICE